MSDFDSTEDLKAYLLSHPYDSDEDVIQGSGECYSLSWNKDHWIIRANNKKKGVITKEDIPDTYNIKDSDLIFNMLAALRKGSLSELNIYLEGLHENT